MIRLTINEKYCIEMPDASGNETNPDINMQFLKYANNITRRGWKRWNGGSMLHAELKDLSVPEFLLVMIGNGSNKFDDAKIEFFKPWVKVADSDMSNEVPTGLTNREKPPIYDEEGNIIEPVTIKTWNEWAGDNYTKTSVGGFTYFLSIAATGKSLTDDELMLIYNNADSELVDEKPLIETE